MKKSLLLLPIILCASCFLMAQTPKVKLDSLPQFELRNGVAKPYELSRFYYNKLPDDTIWSSIETYRWNDSLGFANGDAFTYVLDKDKKLLELETEYLFSGRRRTNLRYEYQYTQTGELDSIIVTRNEFGGFRRPHSLSRFFYGPQKRLVANTFEDFDPFYPTTRTTSYTYSVDGYDRIDTTVVTNPALLKTVITKWNFDSAGNVLKQITKTIDPSWGESLDSLTFRYNAQGQIEEKLEVTQNGIRGWRETSFYDSTGFLFRRNSDNLEVDTIPNYWRSYGRRFYYFDDVQNVHFDSLFISSSQGEPHRFFSVDRQKHNPDIAYGEILLPYGFESSFDLSWRPEFGQCINLVSRRFGSNNNTTADSVQFFYSSMVSNIDNEVPRENELTLSPNPTSSHLSISGLTSTTYDELFILNIGGKVILRETNWSSEKPVEVSMLKTGSYILQLSKDGKTFFEKFVKY